MKGNCKKQTNKKTLAFIIIVEIIPISSGCIQTLVALLTS